MKSKTPSFLQSPAWEQFQRRLGHQTRRIDGALIIERSTPVGRYWYVGRAELDGRKLGELTKAAQEARALFVRIDPVVYNSQLAVHSSQQRPTAPTQPQDSLILDLAPSTNDLLAGFHEKTRYNIRIAERHGLLIEESTDPGHRAMKAFLAFARRTARRQAFHYHPDAYYRTMLTVLNQLNDDQIAASVLVAHRNNGPMAAIIVLWTPDTAYYLHGASWYERRQYMAPHLLQWTAIQRAKERGCQAYDFWGIAPPPAASEQLVENGELLNDGDPTHNSQLTTHKYLFDPNHPWAGVTRFKLGFGGETVHYPDSFDVVLNPTRYTLYSLGRRLRRSLPL